MPFSGQCLCAKHRYEIDRKHLNAMHCYCQMCRRAHGTAFSTHLIVRPDEITWLSDRKELTAFESSQKAYREFCPACGSHLLVHGQSGDENLAVPAGTLDGKLDVTILGHMYVEELVPWHHIADDLPQYQQWPPGYGPTTLKP